MPGLQAADTDYVEGAGGVVVTLPDGTPKPKLYDKLMTADSYAPTDLVSEPFPVKDLDFSPDGGYAVYNWELFFHVPLHIAIHLSRRTSGSRRRSAGSTTCSTRRARHLRIDRRSGSGSSCGSSRPTSSSSQEMLVNLSAGPTASCARRR